MNKANKFKRRTHSQNQNFYYTQKGNQNLVNDQNLTLSTDFNNTCNNFSSPTRRVLTQQFQIEPFSQIQNSASLNLNRQTIGSFIKTKRVKLYTKIKSSFRQNDQELNSRKPYQTNFQILKKQIESLQNLQILKGSSENTESNPQIEKAQYNAKIKDWTNNSGFIVTSQFNSGKNISLFEKKRQNIKKVIKSKKFRNYMNPFKKIIEKSERQSENQNNIFIKNVKDQVYAEGFHISSGIQTLKKRQTPQIVKKYYRPQSCNSKRSSSCQTKNSQIQLINYVSLNSTCKNQTNLKVINNFSSKKKQNQQRRILKSLSPCKQRKNQKSTSKDNKNQLQNRIICESKEISNKKNKQILIICM